MIRNMQYTVNTLMFMILYLLENGRRRVFGENFFLKKSQNIKTPDPLNVIWKLS